MGVVIGIDVGGSTTKIIGVENKSIQSPMFVKATDPVTSLFGAFGKYIYDNGITLPEIEMVMLTGVGSAFIDQPLYGLQSAGGWGKPFHPPAAIRLADSQDR